MTRTLLCIIGVLVFTSVSGAEPAVVRGVSSQPALSEGEAVSAARQDAVESLLPRLRDTVAVALKQQARPAPMPSDQALRQVIAAELAANSDLVLDRKVELQKREYADIYYAGVLVDASPKTLDRMTRKAIEVSRASMKRNVHAGASLAALLGVIGITYLGANAFTKGYFTWRLRLLAAASSALAIAAVSGAYYGHAFRVIGG